MSQHLTIAASKGYLLEAALPYLAKAGIEFEDDPTKTRKLYCIDKSNTIKLLMIRPWDVPTYVEQGAADLGITGKDVLEEKTDHVLDLLDLGFGGCRLVIAVPEANNEQELGHNIIVATKYPNCTNRYFQQRGLKAKILKLYGAIELAPYTGLSDIICDLTATGKTLAENHLKIMETLFHSTAHLVANPVSMTLKRQEIIAFIDRISTHLPQENAPT